jgi:hypothetical protein
MAPIMPVKSPSRRISLSDPAAAIVFEARS